MVQRTPIIILDPQSRAQLDTLGRVSGGPTIDPDDLQSPQGRKILSSLPILHDTTYGLVSQSPRDLELLRQFSHGGRPRTTVWAKVEWNPNGTIQNLETPVNVLVAEALVINPDRVIIDIVSNLEGYTSKLPMEWAFGKVNGEEIAVHFSKTIVDLSDLNDLKLVAEQVGPNLSHFLFDTTVVLKMIALAKTGSKAEKKKARQFLNEIGNISKPFLKMMSGARLRPAAHQALYVFYTVTNQARKTIGQPAFNFSIPAFDKPPTVAK